MRRTCRYSKLWWEEQRGRCRWRWTAASASGEGVPLRCSAPPAHRHLHYHHHHHHRHPHCHHHHHHHHLSTDRDGHSWPNWSVERSLHKRQQPREDVRMNPHLYNRYTKYKKYKTRTKEICRKNPHLNSSYIFSLALARFCFVGQNLCSDIWNCLHLKLFLKIAQNFQHFFKNNQIDGTSSGQGVVLFSYLWY